MQFIKNIIKTRLGIRHFFLVLCLVLFIFGIYLELFKGVLSFTINDFVDLLQAHATSNTQILYFIRIPNVMKAIISGCCLALSGMFLQTITKNPLAEPYLLGVSSGAGLAIVLGMMFHWSGVLISTTGFIGAMVSVLLVISLSGFRSFSMLRLILVGLSVNIFAGALISAIMLYNPDATRNMLLVLTGGLNNNTDVLAFLTPLFLIAVALSLYFVPKLNFLILDDSLIQALSPARNYYFIGIVMISAIFTAISVNLAGILGFVGIIVPHMTRLILGYRFRDLFLANILLGSAVILYADFLAKNLLFPLELPLGVVLALLGAPVFILLMICQGKKYYA